MAVSSQQQTKININFLARYTNSQGNFAILNDGTQLDISSWKILNPEKSMKQ